jgi:hypothetical protein
VLDVVPQNHRSLTAIPVWSAAPTPLQHSSMTITEIVHTHPFAAGVAVGILLAYGSLVLCTAFLFTLGKTKTIARAVSPSDPEDQSSGNPGRPLFQESTVGSTDPTSLT